MPITIKDVMSVAADIAADDYSRVTSTMKESLEEIIIKWSNTIAEVLQENSLTAYADEQTMPTPTDEINFWNGRLKNLQNIYEQLCDPRIKTIAAITEKIDSVYFLDFRRTFQNVVESLHEANDVTLYLLPMVNSKC